MVSFPPVDHRDHEKELTHEEARAGVAEMIGCDPGLLSPEVLKAKLALVLSRLAQDLDRLEPPRLAGPPRR